MATLTVASVARTLTPIAAVAAAAGGDAFANSGQEFVYINNASVGAITVTAVVQRQIDGITPAGKAIVVPATSAAVFGPFNPADYNDTTGKVSLTYSGVTTLTVQPFQMVNFK
jgi:hypothetical protein